MEKENNNLSFFSKYWPMALLALIAGFAGLIIGKASTGSEGQASVAEIINSIETKSSTAKGSTDIGGKEDMVMGSEDSIAVKDQIAGSRVVLEKLSLTKESWVAIHDSVNVVPGWILGASKFAAGEHSIAAVNLKRATEAGKQYFAMIHASNGDGDFEFRAGEADGPLMGPDGKPIMVGFQTVTQ